MKDVKNETEYTTETKAALVKPQSKNEVALRRLQNVLVPTHSRVIATAASLLTGKSHWKPETLVRRMNTAGLSTIEQYIYVTYVGTLGVHPESLRKMLDVICANKPIQISDLTITEASDDHLISNYIWQVQRLLITAVDLVEKTSMDYSGISIAMEDAAKLVVAYGEDVEDVIASIVENLGNLAERLADGTGHEEKIISFAIHFLANEILNYCENRGLAYPLDIMDFFADPNHLLRIAWQRETGENRKPAVDTDYFCANEETTSC